MKKKKKKKPVKAWIASITEISNISTIQWKETALLVKPLQHKTHISEISHINPACLMERAQYYNFCISHL